VRFDHVKLTAPRAGYKAKLLIDGVEPENVSRVQIDVGVNEVTKVILTIIPETLDVEAINPDAEKVSGKDCPFQAHADDCDCKGAGGDR
jgi:hypothetical protein